MTEAEKVITSFIELLENKDPVLTPIIKQMEKMKQQLSSLSTDKEKAMLIQEYCKPHLELKNTLRNMAARANLKDFIQYQSPHKQSYELERVMNKFLLDSSPDKDNQDSKLTSPENTEQTRGDNE